MWSTKEGCVCVCEIDHFEHQHWEMDPFYIEEVLCQSKPGP